jgi:hypothetical protein
MEDIGITLERDLSKNVESLTGDPGANKALASCAKRVAALVEKRCPMMVTFTRSGEVATCYGPTEMSERGLNIIVGTPKYDMGFSVEDWPETNVEETVAIYREEHEAGRTDRSVFWTVIAKAAKNSFLAKDEPARQTAALAVLASLRALLALDPQGQAEFDRRKAKIVEAGFVPLVAVLTAAGSRRVTGAFMVYPLPPLLEKQIARMEAA